MRAPAEFRTSIEEVIRLSVSTEGLIEVVLLDADDKVVVGFVTHRGAGMPLTRRSAVVDLESDATLEPSEQERELLEKAPWLA